MCVCVCVCIGFPHRQILACRPSSHCDELSVSFTESQADTESSAHTHTHTDSVSWHLLYISAILKVLCYHWYRGHQGFHSMWTVCGVLTSRKLVWTEEPDVIGGSDSQSILRKSLSNWKSGKLSQLSGSCTSRAASMSAEYRHKKVSAWSTIRSDHHAKASRWCTEETECQK